MRPFGDSEWTSQTVYVDSEAPNELLKLCISIRRLRIDFSNLFFQFGGSEWTSQLVLSIRRLRIDLSNLFYRFRGSEWTSQTCFIDSEAPNRPEKKFFANSEAPNAISKLFRSIRRLRKPFANCLGRFGGSECRFQTVYVNSEALNAFRKLFRSIRRLRMNLSNLFCRFGGS